MQIKDLKTFYQESSLDAAVWVATFMSVVIIDIDVGLLIGLFFSILVLYKKGYKSYACMLGPVPNTDIYVDVQMNENIKELPTTKIFRYYGSINFATRNGFKKILYKNIEIDHRVIRRASLVNSPEEAVRLNNNMRALIIDLGAVAHLDMSGYRTLIEIKNEMKLLGVTTFVAKPSSCVYDLLKKAVKLKEQPIECFPTVHDAVLFSNEINH